MTVSACKTGVTERHYYPQLADVKAAAEKIARVAAHTPLQLNRNLSLRYGAQIYLKREDLQAVRSYKLRGAYNKISSLKSSQLQNGVVCASAGNHAQGVAFACRELDVHGVIFMPVPTPAQKVEQVKMWGRDRIVINLVGDTFDDAYAEAIRFCEGRDATFIHPFDDEKVIEGQATVGLEILKDLDGQMDYLLLPVGGGGLAAGVGSVVHSTSPNTRVIGVEPAGAPSMSVSLQSNENTTLVEIDKFIDGAAVCRVGERNFNICRKVLNRMITVDEGAVCSTILDLYNAEGIVVEPAGALSIAALEKVKEDIAGKTVVCVVSGSNNEIARMEEIRERSLLHSGLKHYFIIRFPQRAGALREFVTDILSPTDDITHFQYSKKTSRELGPAVVGIELQRPEHYAGLSNRLNKSGFIYEYLNDQPDLFQILI